MDPVQPQFDFDIFRWGRIFGVLSLDLAQPYVPMMKLQVPDGAFFGALRGLIGDFRAQEVQNPGAERDFAVAAFAWIDSQYPPEFAQHLRAWGQRVFQYSAEDGRQEFLWNLMIRNRGSWSPTQAEPAFVTAVRECLRSRPLVSVYALPPTSEWDRAYYARHGCDENCNPMHNVQSTITYCQFVESWHEALAKVGNALSEADANAVILWGQDRAKSIRIPTDRFETSLDFPPLPMPWRT